MKHPSFEKFVEDSSFIAYVKFDDEVKETGNTQHFHLSNIGNEGDLEGIIMGKTPHPVDSLITGIVGLVIVKEDQEDAFYLYGLDSNWGTVTDTWHKTIESARSQAEFEYEGITKKWVIKKNLNNIPF